MSFLSSTSSKNLAHRWISVLFDKCYFVPGLLFGLKQLFSSRAKSRCRSSDGSLEIFHNMGDGYDKQPVAGGLSLWPSQVSKDSPVCLWLIHGTTKVLCVTPVAWDRVNPWFRAMYKYGTQFYAELNRKENAEKEKELQLLRATATQKRSGPGLDSPVVFKAFGKRTEASLCCLVGRQGLCPGEGALLSADVATGIYKCQAGAAEAHLHALLAQDQNLLLWMRGREKLK